MSAGSIAKTLFGLVFQGVSCSSLSGKDNGFGNNYVWAGSLESGLQIASKHQKPMMLIIHKSWCSACKNLKPKFAESADIQTLSKHFVMVNLVDEEEPHGVSFSPDGNYIPRILFLSPTGMVDLEVFNEEGSSQHKYFYSRPEQITKSMKKVLRKYKVEQFDGRDGEMRLTLMTIPGEQLPGTVNAEGIWGRLLPNTGILRANSNSMGSGTYVAHLSHGIICNLAEATIRWVFCLILFLVVMV